MRRLARVDCNHLDICHALRQQGASVRSTATIGMGFPKAVVGFRGFNYLIQIKDGTKKWELTDDQEAFHSDWKGQIVIVDSIESAIEWMDGFRK